MARHSSLWRSTLLALFAVQHVAKAWDDLIMPPLDGKSGPTVVILYGQGADIPTEEYEGLGAAIQTAAPYPVWFATPQCPNNVASIPLGLEAGSRKNLKQKHKFNIVVSF
jgi:hypothetical protein